MTETLVGEFPTDMARTKGLVLTLTTVATLIGIQINAGAESQVVADASARSRFPTTEMPGMKYYRTYAPVLFHSMPPTP